MVELGYDFKDKRWLEQALRHRSLNKNTNERLEFLGDAVLDFLIGEALFQRYTELNEGELSRLRANLVNSVALAQLADRFNLSSYLQFSAPDLNRATLAITHRQLLADAVEAIIGAIYLDGGLEVVREKVLSWYSAFLERPLKKDPKSRLQELLQKRKWALPRYVLLESEGKDNAKIFYIEGEVTEAKIKVVKKARTKKEAQQAVAAEILHILGEE